MKNNASASVTTNQVQTQFSLLEMLNMKQNDISSRVFMFNDKAKDLFNSANEFSEIQSAIKGCSQFKGLDLENIPTFKYFQIKRNMTVTQEGKERFTMQFIDISAKIFYDDIKAQEEFMSLITSTISHEMRNPLNSIISQCKIMAQHNKDLKNLADQLKHHIDKEYFENIHTICNRIEGSNHI